MCKIYKIVMGAVVGLVMNANASIGISTIGQTYSENFNLLGNVDGSSYTFTNNSTLAGWWANSESMDISADQYVAENGTATSGQVYSFGADGASDRALGYLGSGGNDYFNMALALENNTGETLSEIVVSYTGEQWRSGGNTSDNNNSLVFSYHIFSAGTGIVPSSTDQTGWTTVGALEFMAPQKNVSAGSLDGNLAANQSAFSQVAISDLTWNDGEELWIRFSGNDGVGTDAGLAVDNLSIQAVPEPATLILTAFGGVLALASRRMKHT